MTPQSRADELLRADQRRRKDEKMDELPPGMTHESLAELIEFAHEVAKVQAGHDFPNVDLRAVSRGVVAAVIAWQEERRTTRTKSDGTVEAFAIVPLGSPPNTLAELVKRERELWQAREDAEYDERRAGRDGSIVSDAIKATTADASKEWLAAYTACRDAVRDIPAALGVTADNLKRFL